LLLE
jgi:hypothetical protein